MAEVSVSAQLVWVLRLEGLLVFISSLVLYANFSGNSWSLFLLLFFIPDLSLLGYLRDNRIGAFCYNLGHTYIVPLSMGTLCYVLNHPEWIYVSMIWVAHIGFDRALGFGLKQNDGFRYTHLGKIGRD